MKKEEARECMKMLRSRLSDEERFKRNQKIRERLMKMEAMQRIEWFYPFVSYKTEVDTIQIIDEVLKQGKKRVAVPRVEGESMDFYEITSMEELVPGYKGILEPVTDKKIEAQNGVMLLPGLAFDQLKNRVGYGGGYYDRYLERCTGDGLITVAIAYDFQIVDIICAEDFDRKPDWIISDQRLL